MTMLQRVSSTIHMAVDEEGIAVLTLNRPEARNAISDDMRSQMIDLLEEAAANSEIRALIITGTGKGFCAGGDIKGMEILAHAAVQEDVAKGTLVAHAIERPGIRSTVSLTTLKERRSSRLALSWEKILMETLEELVTTGAWKEATLWLSREGNSI